MQPKSFIQMLSQLDFVRHEDSTSKALQCFGNTLRTLIYLITRSIYYSQLHIAYAGWAFLYTCFSQGTLQKGSAASGALPISFFMSSIVISACALTWDPLLLLSKPVQSFNEKKKFLNFSDNQIILEILGPAHTLCAKFASF